MVVTSWTVAGRVTPMAAVANAAIGGESGQGDGQA